MGGTTPIALGVQTGLLVVAILLVVGSILYVVYSRAATSAADQALTETITRVVPGRPLTAPPGTSLYVVEGSGRVRTHGDLFPGMPDREALAAVSRDGKPRQHRVDAEGAAGRSYMVRTERVGGAVVQAAQDREPGDEARERLLSGLFTAAAAGVLLAGLMAAWLAFRTVTPLERTVAVQRRFVADAGHELRTPLTLLSLRTQMLSRRLRARGDDRSAGDVDAVVADTVALGEILDELLVAADPGSRSDRETVDLALLTRDVVDACDGRADHLGLELQLRVEASAPTSYAVHGVPASLRRAVTALVDNALDHAEHQVVAHLGLNGREVHLRVVDDGPGISAEVLPRMFDRFSGDRHRRDGASTSGGRRHYGLGLALVADIAASHGGSVTAGPSGIGSGAALDLSLPVAQSRRRWQRSGARQ